MITNIEQVLASATPEFIEGGKAWYPTTHEWAAQFGNVEIGAGVIASLSPNSGWKRNLALALKALTDGHIDGGTLSRSVENANRILDGEHALDVLGPKALKTRAFYENIVNPDGDAVTIDRHAHDIALGERYGNRNRPLLQRVGGYESIADAYRTVARSAGLPVAAVQAITWCQWRGAVA